MDIHLSTIMANGSSTNSKNQILTDINGTNNSDSNSDNNSDSRSCYCMSTNNGSCRPVMNRHNINHEQST